MSRALRPKGHSGCLSAVYELPDHQRNLVITSPNRELNMSKLTPSRTVTVEFPFDTDWQPPLSNEERYWILGYLSANRRKKVYKQYDPWPGRLTQILLDDNAHYAQMLWKKMT